ncbi:hypothetical protein ScPMuIL_006052 [Solemya velum]
MRPFHITVATLLLIIFPSVTVVSTHKVTIHFPEQNEGAAKIYEFKTNSSLSHAKKKLSNHGIQTFYTKYQAAQCAMECLKKENCKSFNFLSSGRFCQLNDATHDDYPDDFADDEADYHLRDAFSIDPEALGPCVPSPCKNGARCLDTKSSKGERIHACLCDRNWTGENCDIPASLPEWGEWQPWDACSASCNVGWSLRRRACVDSETGEEMKSCNCYGRDIDYKACDLLPCPKWDVWGDWGECSTANTCGKGVKVRQRGCTNGGTAGVDRFCLGHTNQTAPCEGISCHGIVRLANGTDYGEGNVLLFDEQRGKWMEVCADNWDLEKADIVCKQIGFVGGHEAITDGRYSNEPVRIKNEKVITACDGTEKRLQGCRRTTPDPEDPEACSAKAAVQCRVRGIWSLWGSWGECSVTCEHGRRLRTRTCTHPPPNNNGTMCPGSEKDYKNCTLPECPEDGYWSPWTPWSDCDVTCSNGTKFRTRTCEGQRFGGEPCGNKTIDYADCFPRFCPVDGTWTTWMQWTECPVTCGRGFRNRSRECLGQAYDGAECPGESAEIEICNDISCPVDGSWKLWVDWSPCTVSCGGGLRNRSRECDEAKFNGTDCIGPAEQSELCETDPCPVDGVWDTWTQWDDCTVTCGGGTQMRNRTCIGPFHNGADCPDKGLDVRMCNEDPCPVDGEWNPWTSWTPCNVSCGGGQLWRTRECENPKHGGFECEGDSLEVEDCNTFHCPVDGVWSGWNDWTDCSKTCENGTQTRNRTCLETNYGGKECPGNHTELRLCNPEYCPVDGVWVMWTTWSECSLTCGRGTKFRNRTCIGPFHGGENCTGDYDQSTACNPNNCPVPGLWLSWGLWSDCSVTCENGTRIRKRECDPPLFGGEDCEGPYEEIEDCYPRECPVNGTWEEWGDWEICSVTCGGSNHSRKRICIDPLYGGDNCSGLYVETRECETQPCPVDGEWDLWTTWGECSLTCAQGVQWRHRNCTNPLHGGEDCIGNSTESQECNDFPCPVTGVFEDWTSWSECSLSCGNGTHYRNRTCIGPFYGGENCTGPWNEMEFCNVHKCPVNGIFTNWTEWTDCSLSCGIGDQWRDRSCIGPFYDGLPCDGDFNETRTCNEHPCPVDGVWTAWTDWEDCSLTCAGGTQGRNRTCIGPFHDGEECPGPDFQTQDCNTFPCPVSGVWTPWTEWDTCSLTCGGGTQGRTRTCDGPYHNGDDCVGAYNETQDCNTHHCPVDGVWFPWTTWGECDVTCGGGTQDRFRVCDEPKYGGAPCDGPNNDTQECNMHNCPVDGFWYEWDDWSECNVTCNGGKQVRERICEPPKYGGAECDGEPIDYKVCNENKCPIPGIWLEWTSWSHCTLTCGSGQRHRSRECNMTAYGDLTVDCEGAAYEDATCHDFLCEPYAATCTEWGIRGLYESTEADIQVDEWTPPGKVYCDMESHDGIGVTVISHNIKNRTNVTGYEGAGIYEIAPQYQINFESAIIVVDKSKECEQYMKWECKASTIHNPYHPEKWSTYWENRIGRNPEYFPGATPGEKKCACGEAGTCSNSTLSCNCDMNDDVWRYDDGYVREKEQLPIKLFRVGDTGTPHSATTNPMNVIHPHPHGKAQPLIKRKEHYCHQCNMATQKRVMIVTDGDLALKRSVVKDSLDIMPYVIPYKYRSKEPISVEVSNITTNTVAIQPNALLCELHPVTIEGSIDRQEQISNLIYPLAFIPVGLLKHRPEARSAILHMGDQVLVKYLAFDSKHKLANKWKKDAYAVVKQPNAAIPVYVMKKETRVRRSRTMHRKLLLPIESTPLKVSDTAISATPPRIPSKRQRCKASDNTRSTPVITADDAEHMTDTSSSVDDSDDQLLQLEIQRPSMDISGENWEPVSRDSRLQIQM